MNPLLVKLGVTAAALATGGGFAVLSPASSAVAYSSPPLFLDISVQSPANLVARGAAISVPVIVTCNSDGAYVYLRVSEKVGKKVASGNIGTSVGCTGGHQTFLLTVPASSGPAFAKGSAYVAAEVDGCTANFICGTETGSATIKIK
ncbi:MAG: hypothetical protein ACR2N4_14220 [Jatrophihabitans sp.]